MNLSSLDFCTFFYIFYFTLQPCVSLHPQRKKGIFSLIFHECFFSSLFFLFSFTTLSSWMPIVVVVVVIVVVLVGYAFICDFHAACFYSHFQYKNIYMAIQGRLLPHNISMGVIISNHSLVLQGVSRTTAGNYSCVGYNSEGDGESLPFELNVMCK